MDQGEKSPGRTAVDFPNRGTQTNFLNLKKYGTPRFAKTEGRMFFFSLDFPPLPLYFLGIIFELSALRFKFLFFDELRSS
jgi:hypothetical protein